jgi:hypothetical protein
LCDTIRRDVLGDELIRITAFQLEPDIGGEEEKYDDDDDSEGGDEDDDDDSPTHYKKKRRVNGEKSFNRWPGI